MGYAHFSVKNKEEIDTATTGTPRRLVAELPGESRSPGNRDEIT